MLRRVIWRAAIASVVLFAALFLGRLAYDFSRGTQRAMGEDRQFAGGLSNFEVSRKNYASVKFKADFGAPAPQQPTLGEGQKYEKIATIGETTREFDAGRKAIMTAVEGVNGLVQYEQLQGYGRQRTLHLGIGVPPAKFDEFVEAVSNGKIGKITNLSIVKNDKTTEYRKLRAQRETLEKALKALAELNASGGSVDERLKVQSRIGELESSLQNLGVALGDFDAENEFCTVKITLSEAGPPPSGPSVPHRVFAAFVWSAEYFLALTGGFLALCVAFWLGMIALSIAVRVSQRLTQE